MSNAKCCVPGCVNSITGFKDGNKDAPPVKKVKLTEKPPEQLTTSVETNVPEAQSSNVEETAPDPLESPSPSHSDVPEPETEPGPFSWQKSVPICVEKDDILSDISQADKEVPVVELDVENKKSSLNEVTEVSLKHEEDEEEKYVSEKHAEFSCDYCLGEIIGFRYTCVQCENFDLCGACEGKLVHPLHYMLRVPKPRPFNEVRSVIAAIRVKIKLLEEAFKQNSEDWADVVIKKEEDPLEVEETTVPQEPTADQSLEESVVPHFDTKDSQEANKQDIKLPSENVPGKSLHHSPSTYMAASSIQKGKDVSKRRVILSGISDKDVIFVQNDVVSNANLIFTQRKDIISNTNVTLVKQNTVISNKALGLDNESKGVANKNVRLAQQNASTNLIFLQENQIIPKTDVAKYLQKDLISNIKTTSIEDITVKTGSNSNVEQTKSDPNQKEMFEEYLDAVWLDESILAEDNNDKYTISETNQNKSILADENIQIDKGAESKEKEETSLKEKAIEAKETINKRTRRRTKEIKILKNKMKEATTSQEDVIQPSNMLPVSETDDVTVVRTNVNQCNVEKPYMYYYYKLLPKREKHK